MPQNNPFYDAIRMASFSKCANEIVRLTSQKTPTSHPSYTQELVSFFDIEYYDFEILKYLVIMSGANFDYVLEESDEQFESEYIKAYRDNRVEWKASREIIFKENPAGAELDDAIAKLNALSDQCVEVKYQPFQKSYSEHCAHLEAARQALRDRKSAQSAGAAGLTRRRKGGDGAGNKDTQVDTFLLT
ncbi:MAG: hypothetical protein K0U29_06285 [Gammaproteobacteria bacterium]|nr:hypothetical protein [Gammaproteobacteria bacterium]MCH9744523.1 hypothetical protein [Gammaproteobacteria bacterium]